MYSSAHWRGGRGGRGRGAKPHLGHAEEQDRLEEAAQGPGQLIAMLLL